MNKTELEQSMKARIDELESNIAVLKKEMAALQEVEKPAKWELKGGKFCLGSDGYIREICETAPHREAGALFPSREVAESARDARIFFQRLQCLAAELNPSGKVGGKYEIYWSALNNRWKYGYYHCPSTAGCMFETSQAAEKACEILNRDGVKPPAAASEPLR
jgi:hypothetical protein